MLLLCKRRSHENDQAIAFVISFVAVLVVLL